MSSDISWLALIFLLAIGQSSSIRLPDSTYPLLYDLKLSIDVESSTYSGSVLIYVNVTSANSRSIALNYHEIEVENVFIYLASDTTNRNLLNGTRPNPNQQIIEFQTAEDLVQFEGYVLRMDFRGAIRSDLKGLYMSSYFINGIRRFASSLVKYSLQLLINPNFLSDNWPQRSSLHTTLEWCFPATMSRTIKPHLTSR